MRGRRESRGGLGRVLSPMCAWDTRGWCGDDDAVGLLGEGERLRSSLGRGIDRRSMSKREEEEPIFFGWREA